MEFGSVAMFRTLGKMEGGVMTEGWETKRRSAWERRSIDEQWVGLEGGRVESTMSIKVIKSSDRWSA